jgi:hypothetical protein
MATDWVVVWVLFVMLFATAFVIVRLRRSHRPFGRGVGFAWWLLIGTQVVILIVWFGIAPDPRFGWGPLLALAGLLLAISVGDSLAVGVWASHRRLIVSVPIMVLIGGMGLALIRDPAWWIERESAGPVIQVVPLPEAELEMINGVARTIGPDDRCWRSAVPCVPWYSNPS